MTNDDILKHFNKVVREYLIGDLNWLLAKRAPTLGPIVSILGACVDCCGGYLDGFSNNNSKLRSKNFMTAYMDLSDSEANLVYAYIRCGYVHEGLSKSRVGWFADYERHIKKTWLFRYNVNCVAINLVELAHLLIDGVHRLAADTSKLCFLPSAPANSDVIIEDACTRAGDLNAILDIYHDKFKIRGSYSFDAVLKEIHVWRNDGWPFPNAIG